MCWSVMACICQSDQGKAQRQDEIIGHEAAQRLLCKEGHSTGRGTDGGWHFITAGIQRPEQTCGDCALCSLACLLSTALLAAERADPPLSLRLQSCSRVLLLLPLALQTTIQQHQRMPFASLMPSVAVTVRQCMVNGRRQGTDHVSQSNHARRTAFMTPCCLPHARPHICATASQTTANLGASADSRAQGEGAAAEQGAEHHVPEAPALRGDHAGGPGLAPLQLRDDGRQSRRHAAYQRLEAFRLPAAGR